MIKDIAQCNHIVSSSLHGIVTAHSLNIPAVWVKLSDKVVGDGYKFRDYFSVYNTEPNQILIGQSTSIQQIISRTWKPNENKIQELKNGLVDVFESI